LRWFFDEGADGFDGKVLDIAKLDGLARQQTQHPVIVALRRGGAG